MYTWNVILQRKHQYFIIWERRLNLLSQIIKYSCMSYFYEMYPFLRFQSSSPMYRSTCPIQFLYFKVILIQSCALHNYCEVAFLSLSQLSEKACVSRLMIEEVGYFIYLNFEVYHGVPSLCQQVI